MWYSRSAEDIKRTGAINSPAYPAAWLLFGMLFALAVAHFMAISWPRSATIAFYALTLVWVSVLAWREQRHVWSVTAPDVMFIGFVLLVSASLFSQTGFSGEPGKFARYLPFMVAIPYLCGRLMRRADIDLFSRIILIAGTTMLPLLLIDRFTSLGQEGGHWPFFGQNHGALLAGALLAAVLLVLCARVLGCRNPNTKVDRPKLLVFLGLIGLVTVFLVWVSARGWLLAGLAGVAVSCLSARHHLLAARIGLVVAVLAISVLTIMNLPRLDPMAERIYAKLLTPAISTISTTPPTLLPAPVSEGLARPIPVLGEASCRPFREGIDSVAMRRVLYREAVAIFMEHPWRGIGATRFGERSCTGPEGFPHSTILQGFAELGLIGGGLLIVLLMLAAVTLVRPFLSVRHGSRRSANAFILSLFAAFLVGDQIYGNYFMSVGTWLMLGIAASMRANDKQKAENRA